VNTTDSANYGYADSPPTVEHLLIIARKRSLLSAAVRKKGGKGSRIVITSIMHGFLSEICRCIAGMRESAPVAVT
jgi:hypothetical protein